jgi:uncharacterized protein YdeI (YjbR/CyaY-like superfamily)
MKGNAKSGIVRIPKDFRMALSRNKTALEAFEKLPPSHKREYIEAIKEAKKPETRARRIQQAFEILASYKK